MNKIIAITGATGFIGQKLTIRHLMQGDSVRILSRRLSNQVTFPDSVNWFRGDLCEIDDLQAFVNNVDVLYNCAGEIRDEHRMESLHIDGVRTLAEASSGRVKHWVQLSSVGVYGPVKNELVNENSMINPIGKYEITKAVSDKIVMEFATKGSFSYSILRPSNVYGATMTNQSLFNMIAMIQRGLFFYIGKAGASANYIHVDNVVEGLIICGSNPVAKGRIYNLSDHRTLEYFVHTISDRLNRSAPSFRLPYSIAYTLANTLGRLPRFPLTPSRLNALANRSIYSTSLIENELKYQHIVSMEDGLTELVHAYEQKSI